MAAAPARCLRSGQPRRSPGSSAASCCAAEHRRRQAGIIAQSTRRSYTPVVAVSGISRSQLLVPLLLSAVGLLWSLAGCRTGAELVEAELRRKEREERTAQPEIARLRVRSAAPGSRIRKAPARTADYWQGRTPRIGVPERDHSGSAHRWPG
jgi:hypothetical protein